MFCTISSNQGRALSEASGLLICQHVFLQKSSLLLPSKWQNNPEIKVTSGGKDYTFLIEAISFGKYKHTLEISWFRFQTTSIKEISQ